MTSSVASKWDWRVGDTFRFGNENYKLYSRTVAERNGQLVAVDDKGHSVGCVPQTYSSRGAVDTRWVHDLKHAEPVWEFQVGDTLDCQFPGMEVEHLTVERIADGYVWTNSGVDSPANWLEYSWNFKRAEPVRWNGWDIYTEADERELVTLTLKEATFEELWTEIENRLDARGISVG